MSQSEHQVMFVFLDIFHHSSVTPCNLMPEYFPGRKAILENPVWGLNRGRGALDAQAPVPSANQKKLTEHEIGDRLSIVNPKTKECAAP